MSDGTRAIVRAHHDAWTGGDYERATSYLAPDLITEVPLNRYRDAADFAAALAGFGQLVRGTSILAEFAQAGEALLLYDMDVAGVGRIRVAEHFSVAGGRIARIRHVHDTAALRAAGFEPAEVSG